METAIAFAAAMLLTLIALALVWTRLSKQRGATVPHEKKFGVAKMTGLTGERNPAASAQEKQGNSRPERVGTRPAA
jgi:hypothetical protein